MKAITILVVVLSIHNATFCQDTVTMPPKILLTEKQLKESMEYSRISSYDKEIGRDFGEFSAIDINGKTVSTKDLLGKVTFVHFWFDACSPCHYVFEPLNALYTKYKADSNFQVMSFTFDGNETLKKNVAKYELLYRNISVSNALCHKLMGDYRGFSCTYLVDQKGKIVFGHSGVNTNGSDVFADSFIPKIDSLLSQGANIPKPL